MGNGYLLGVLFFGIISSHITLSRGTQLIQPFNDSVIPRVYITRIRSVNTTAPVSSVLRINETAQKLILPVFTLLDELYGLIESRRARNDYLACNLSPTDRWSTSAMVNMMVFQQGSLNRSCFSEIDVRSAVDLGVLDPSAVYSIQHVMVQSRRALFDAFSRMPLPTNDNWTDINAPYEMKGVSKRYNDQICTQEKVLAFRIDQQWYVQVKMTNRPLDLFLSDHHRQTLMEWVPRTFDHSLHMIQKRLVDDKLENSTTVVSMWSGYGHSIRGEQFESATGAVAEAFRENIVQVELAADAVTPSNIAILALPMIMNAIPVAFVADFNLFGIFVYVLFTDIISTIPFIIKGTELVRSALPRRPVVTGWYGGNDSLGQMEIWYVQCNGQESFRKSGIIFIVVGCTMLFGGLIIEAWGWHYMRRRKLKSGHFEGQVDGPFGRVLMEKTSKGIFGATESILQAEYARQTESFEENIARRPENMFKSSIQSFGGMWRRHPS